MLGYYFYPNIDDTHWVRHIAESPLVLMPTKERAIVEYIGNEKWCDEGILIEALKSYMDFHDLNFRQEDKKPVLADLQTLLENHMFEVADFFQVPRDKILYWFTEAVYDEEE